MSYPIAIFWVLLIMGLFSRGPMLLYIFFGAWSFAAFAAIPPALTGGVTLTPAWIAAVFIFIKIVLEEGPERVIRTMFDVRRVGLLTLCGIYGVISALLFPRLFAGVVDVIPMRVTILQRPVGLGPTTANLTQTLYFLITVTTCTACYLLCLRPNKLQQSANALLFGGAVVVFTGLLDWITGLVGAANLLAPFRTATYSLLTDTEVMNARRIVGLTPEASSFAAAGISFLAPILFLRNIYATAFTRNVTVPLVVVLLGVMVVISTSSSGYVGLVVMLLVAGAHWVWMATRSRGAPASALVVFYSGIIALLSLIAIWPQTLEWPIQMFSETVLKKTGTSSYTERTMWNDVSLKAFVDTWGLGAGLGSARASSWPVSVLSNIGVPGSLLLAGFLLHIARARPMVPSEYNDTLSVGIKFGLVPTLIVGSLVGTSANIGLLNAWMFGIVGVLCWPPVQSSLVAPRSLAALHRGKPQRERARARALTAGQPGSRPRGTGSPGGAPT